VIDIGHFVSDNKKDAPSFILAPESVFPSILLFPPRLHGTILSYGTTILIGRPIETGIGYYIREKSSTLIQAKAGTILLKSIINGMFQDCALEAGSSVTGGQTVVNPWCSIGGVASTICQPNQYIV